MKKHYYKKYYETHKEQEKTRTLAYYHEHKAEILAKKKANYRNKPKMYKTTLRERLAITKKALELACERIKYFEQQQDLEMGVIEFFGKEIDYKVDAIVENYINEAKEELKGGSNY